MAETLSLENAWVALLPSFDLTLHHSYDHLLLLPSRGDTGGKEQRKPLLSFLLRVTAVLLLTAAHENRKKGQGPGYGATAADADIL